ncbi:colicin D domain-containing protein [Haloarcula hispanica]|uniref:colicin D domain-containing protein n=1 Tax=Haloarcula hispanica TaxID=51589 RepID=UPI001CDA24F6|nr:colicin D domain-containing protein [Haloarcula hispanica]
MGVALNDLAESDQDAADALLQMDDAATQRRFVRAYESGEVDSDELTTALRRYDELDANEKRTADAMVMRGGDDGVSLLDEQVCNSPCDSFTEAWHGLKQTDSVSSNDATTFRNNLLGGVQRGEISDDRAADLLGDTKQLATDEGRDVTDVINRDDRFSRALIRQYEGSDSVGTDTLRRMDQVGEIDLPDGQIERKYKHADDFGVTGNNNPENQEAFREAIAEHTVNPNTERIEGRYTRLEGDQSVTHLYNPNTGNNIIIDDGEFLTGFKLTQGQRTNMRNTGVIGGG